MSAGFGSFLLNAVFLITTVGAVDNYKRFCTFNGFELDIPNNDIPFYPENIDVSFCTHLTFAFASVDPRGLTIEPFRQKDIAMYKRMNALKSKKPGLKTFLSVGGFVSNPATFKTLLSDGININTFVVSSSRFLRKHGFDGIDLVWQWPSSPPFPKSYRSKFTQLIQILRLAYNKDGLILGKPPLLISAGFAVNADEIRDYYDPVALARYLDIVNLLTFDFHGYWDNLTVATHPAPLYGQPGDLTHSMAYVAGAWSSLGIPKHKLLLAVTFYSRAYTIDPTTNRITGPGVPPVLAYYEICNLLQNGTAHYTLPVQKVPYLTHGNQWVAYEDEHSLLAKVNFVVNNGYGGLLLWAMDLDDFKGKCGTAFPLMNAVKNAFNNAIG